MLKLHIMLQEENIFKENTLLVKCIRQIGDIPYFF